MKVLENNLLSGTYGGKRLTALDSNMTFTSPSTTGPFCRLMTAALLPTSGKTYHTRTK